MGDQPKAVALNSGGLDSMLAVRVAQEQGVHVEGINFYTGFCVEGHTQAVRKKDRDKPKRNNALWVAEQLGIRLHIVDISQEYVGIVTNPRHGYGQNLNPCLDCKGFMVAKAREWMDANGFDFLVTGEVMGQRPMSQRRDTFPVVEEEGGAEDRLLRPWPSATGSRTIRSHLAAAASSPTRTSRASSPICGKRAASAPTISTMSCCSRWAATCARRPTSS